MGHVVANVIIGINLKDVMKQQNLEDYDERYIIKINNVIIAKDDSYMLECKLRDMKNLNYSHLLIIVAINRNLSLNKKLLVSTQIIMNIFHQLI